ncbi:MAG: sugar-binding protein, partial [Lentisphaeria bacterium]
YEIGNEDNGPSKFLYTEVGRHAAAGLHAADPFAQIANSGTAFCDVNWLKMQADRGLFHWLDALCVHPYTTADSPEKWGVYEQAQSVVALADQLGGMKALWTTEFGWPAEVPALNRADWTPRHFMIGVAAGYDKHGLYAWDGHFGIYDNGRPFLSAVSTQAMAKFLEGARFAGILERTPERWAVVWEKFGEPVLAAWSVTGSQSWSVPVGSGKVRVYDLFGNEQPARVANGTLTLELSTGPQYVTGASPALTATAWTNQLAWLRDRADIPANRLRIALLEARMGRTVNGDAPATTADPAAFPRLAAAAMARAQAADLDLPGLRWAAQEFKNLELERRFAEVQGRRTFAKRLTAAQALLADYAGRELLPDAARRFTAVWPYLYTLDADGKTLVERLQFVPGNPREVKMRVNNYARRACDAEVSLRLPPGWRAQPAARKIRLTPGQAAETTFQVTCPNGKVETPILTARVAIPGKPVVEVPYDQVEIAPAVKVVLPPLEALLPAAPLRLELRNLDRQAQSGRVRLLLNGQTTAAARTDFSGLAPKAKKTIDLPLKPGPVPAFNEWPLTAEVTLADGRSGRQAVTVDFACAVRAVTPPVMDGDLADWRDAAPLHLDQPGYAKGSFGLNWSPEDCSATTWVQWDDQCLYFAAKVRDQTFNQNMRGESIWIQDSFQLAFARDHAKAGVELGLALTPQGPEIFRYTPPAGDVAGARLKVVVSQGQAVYEAAIPWTAIPELGRVGLNDRIRYAVLLNDDDAVVPRRFLERYGGIAQDKDVANFGWLRLIGPPPATATAAPDPAAETNRASVLQEDFEEYPDRGEPDAWQRQIDMLPAPTGVITAGAGRRGSKALVFHNTIGQRPRCYLIYVRELAGLEPGARYQLRAWMKGNGGGNTSGILGVCSDRWGNESFAYAGGGPADGQWHQVTLSFAAPAGNYHVILRNAAAMDRLAIDDLSVERLP